MRVKRWPGADGGCTESGQLSSGVYYNLLAIRLIQEWHFFGPVFIALSPTIWIMKDYFTYCNNI
jgi:hypothetical protein